MKRTNIIIMFITGLIIFAAVSLFAKDRKDIERERKLIWSYHQQGNWQSAIQAAKKYLRLVPQDETIWLILAENYMRSDKLTEAEGAAKKALSLNSESSWALRTLSGIYSLKAEQSPQLKQEYLSMAQLNIEKALSMAPDDVHVNAQAAHVYLAQGKTNKALQAVNKALELKPEEKRLLDLKKQILSGTE